jgi:hypothetical protein
MRATQMHSDFLAIRIEATNGQADPGECSGFTMLPMPKNDMSPRAQALASELLRHQKQVSEKILLTLKNCVRRLAFRFSRRTVGPTRARSLDGARE